MNRKKAFDILELSDDDLHKAMVFDAHHLLIIKKQYYKLALKYHPDKQTNKQISAKTKTFNDICDAYEYLISTNGNNGNNKNEWDEMGVSPQYFDILENFIILNVTDPDERRELAALIKIIKEAIASFGSNGSGEKDKSQITPKEIAEILFTSIQKLDDALAHTHKQSPIINFVCKYRHLLHFAADFIELYFNRTNGNHNANEPTAENKQGQEQGQGHLQNEGVEDFETVYRLTPTVEDMMDGKIYKFAINEKEYLIPLWQTENYIDVHVRNDGNGNGNGEDMTKEVLIICDPIMPDFMCIDVDNNLEITLHISTGEILSLLEKNMEMEIYTYQLGNHIFNIDLCKLNVTKMQQTICFVSRGIPTTIENNTDSDSDSDSDNNVIKRSNVIFRIYLF
jgi:hypothetical protein